MDRHINTFVSLGLIALTYTVSVALVMAATQADLLNERASQAFRHRLENLTNRNSTIGPTDSSSHPAAQRTPQHLINLHTDVQDITVRPQTSFRRLWRLLTPANSTVRE